MSLKLQVSVVALALLAGTAAADPSIDELLSRFQLVPLADQALLRP